MKQPATQILIRFMRLATEASTGEDILPLLADAAVEHAQCDASAVLTITKEGRLRIVASRNLLPSLASFELDSDDLGTQLGRRLALASNGAYAQGHTRMMVSSGELYGALVLLFRDAGEVDAARLELANALTEAAAIRLDKTEQHAELVRTNVELRASQEALVRSGKLRAVGQMASGIAHDLNNILNPVILHLQLAKRAVARGDAKDAEQAIDDARSAARRGVETVERLRDFSRQAPERPAEAADLDALVHDAIAIAKPRMASRGAMSSIVHEKSQASPLLARVHASEIVSALVNLVVNAIDAMPKGGRITVRTAAKDGGVFVEVADDGPGMPPEVEQRVFEPFFTTKGQEGTGLGLAMVYACVQRHAGHVSLETAPGKGSRFTLWFPCGTLE